MISSLSTTPRIANDNTGIVPPWMTNPAPARNPGIVPPWLQAPFHILPIDLPTESLPVEPAGAKNLPVDATQFVPESAHVSPTSLVDALRSR